MQSVLRRGRNPPATVLAADGGGYILMQEDSDIRSLLL